MGALRAVGGILALIGAALVLFMQVLFILNFGFYGGFILLMILPILALVGGILAIAGKRAGGIIALIVGCLWLVFGILVFSGVYIPWLSDICFLEPIFSVFLIYLSITIWSIFILVETILVLLGGILATAAKSD